MSTTILLALIISVFVFAFIRYILSGVFADIAQEKGYEWSNAFRLCIFLGLLGYLLIYARPNLALRAAINAYTISPKAN